jgi:hypothetical protein
MRYLFRKSKYQVNESDIQAVVDILSSGTFIFIDLFFWAMLFTLMTLTVHASIWGAFFIFVSSYVFGASLFLLLRRYFKE